MQPGSPTPKRNEAALARKTDATSRHCGIRERTVRNAVGRRNHQSARDLVRLLAVLLGALRVDLALRNFDQLPGQLLETLPVDPTTRTT
jgi:hypothetical protein